VDKEIAMDESAQTPSDRFVKWLKNFTEILQESAEVGAENDAWKALLQELHAFGYAFTHMLLRDQASAVTKFEVGASIKYHEDKEEPYRLIPTEIEVLEAEFSAPFLTEVFKLLWSHIVEAEIEPLALLELKRATAYYAPDPWSQMRWPSDRNSSSSTTRMQRGSRCSICQEPARAPYPSCYYCNERPSYHHGGCCPSRWTGRNRQGGRDPPAAPRVPATPAHGGL